MTAVAKQRALPATARTVTVACKVPTGLVLQLQTATDRIETGRNGLETMHYNVFGGRRYFVHGPAYPSTKPTGYPAPPMIEGGYALTRGIPADFWEQWAEQNKMAPYFVPPDGAEHGMIFAYATTDEVASAAREQEKLLSGLEPLSTDMDANGRLTDPRMPKPVTASLSKIGFEAREQQA